MLIPLVIPVIAQSNAVNYFQAVYLCKINQLKLKKGKQKMLAKEISSQEEGERIKKQLEDATKEMAHSVYAIARKYNFENDSEAVGFVLTNIMGIFSEHLNAYFKNATMATELSENKIDTSNKVRH